MGQGLFSGRSYVHHDGKKYSVTKKTNHTIATTGLPRSVCKKFDEKGKLEKERYYDDKGRAELDIDYTDHGNPVKHPKVPHEHTWDWSDPENPKRSTKDD